MNDTPSIISQKEIENRIFTIRGLQVVFMESHFAIPSKQSLGGILFEGQLLDSYVFVANIIKKATPDTFAGIITFATNIKNQINAIRSQFVTLNASRGKHINKNLVVAFFATTASDDTIDIRKFKIKNQQRTWYR